MRLARPLSAIMPLGEDAGWVSLAERGSRLHSASHSGVPTSCRILVERSDKFGDGPLSLDWSVFPALSIAETSLTKLRALWLADDVSSLSCERSNSDETIRSRSLPLLFVCDSICPNGCGDLVVGSVPEPSSVVGATTKPRENKRAWHLSQTWLLASSPLRMRR